MNPARHGRKLGNFELRILNFELLLKSRQETKMLQICIADQTRIKNRLKCSTEVGAFGIVR